MRRPIVLVAGRASRETIEALGPGVEVRHCDGTDHAELLDAARDADAMLVRATSQVDARVLEAARQLKVIASLDAGAGRLDTAAAPRAGVLVVTARTAHAVNNAERTVRLLHTAARYLARSDTGQEGRYSGVELAGTVLGVVGVDEVGVLVAERMRAFGMQTLAFVPGAALTPRPWRSGLPLVALDELLERADFITVHLTGGVGTAGLIGHAELRRVKAAVRIVHDAGSPTVDEEALLTAIAGGRVAAGLAMVAVPPRPTDLRVADSIRMGLECAYWHGEPWPLAAP